MSTTPDIFIFEVKSPSSKSLAVIGNKSWEYTLPFSTINKLEYPSIPGSTLLWLRSIDNFGPWLRPTITYTVSLADIGTKSWD